MNKINLFIVLRIKENIHTEIENLINDERQQKNSCFAYYTLTRQHILSYLGTYYIRYVIPNRSLIRLAHELVFRYLVPFYGKAFFFS